jgi:hypothetical protein
MFTHQAEQGSLFSATHDSREFGWEGEGGEGSGKAKHINQAYAQSNHQAKQGGLFSATHDLSERMLRPLNSDSYEQIE